MSAAKLTFLIGFPLFALVSLVGIGLFAPIGENDIVMPLWILLMILTLVTIMGCSLYSSHKTPAHITTTQQTVVGYEIIGGELRVDYHDEFGEIKDVKFSNIKALQDLEAGGRLVKEKWFKCVNFGPDTAGEKIFVLPP